MIRRQATFFGNGCTSFFEDGEQRADLQESWIVLYLRFLEEKGIDPTTVTFRLPSGIETRPFKTEDGWNWPLWGEE